MNRSPRLLRITTVPISLKLLLRGQLAFFVDNGFDLLAVSADGPEIQSLRDEGIAHVVVPMTRTITPLKDLMALVRLIAVIRKFRPDIVHTHTPKAGLLGMLAAWICRVPLRLHTVAGLPVTEKVGVVKNLLTLAEKVTYACANRVYPNSKGLLHYIIRNIGTSTPLKVIGKGSSNGINTAYFTVTSNLMEQAHELRRQHHICEGDVVFAFIGRIVGDKGINELLAAFDGISREVSCKLLMAGPFEEELDPISAESREILSRNKNVIVMGYLDDVRPMLVTSDIFVFPSYREGFPNVVMQACCMRCACIVSDINGCNEIIQHGETGLVVQPKSVPALMEAMILLAENVSLRGIYSERARNFVVGNFDQQSVWTELLNEYRTLLANSHRRALVV